jgi:hypothetical protein
MTDPTVVVPLTSQLRLAFTAYWSNESPSTEIFYMSPPHDNFSGEHIVSLESQVVTLLETFARDELVHVIFIASQVIEMSADDITNAQWRMLPPLA